MRKIILIAVAALVVIIGGAVFFLFSNLDSIVKTAIETVGSKVAGVKVSVAEVKITLTDGRATIRGLKVANPSGFKTPTAFSLGEITVGIDTGTIQSNPIVIKEITVLAPEVTYEIGGPGGSNIDAIQKNVQSFTAANGGGGTAEAQKPAAAAPAPAADQKDQKKLVITLLQLKDGKLTLATALPGGKATAPLPGVTLHDIGKNSGGATGAQVASQLLDAVSKSAMKSVSSIGIGSLVDGATSGVGNAATGGVTAVKGLFGK